ncbi:MAG: hypothetical protein KGM24_09305, partial [Elusimicrobia bacterium]|nr:hypothetical protein [Elusimicrobiota bacterium]
HEDLLGFRSVRGFVRDPALGRLPDGADVDRIIAQISGQFGIPRADVLATAARFRLNEKSPRRDWLAVYDRLEAANRSHFTRLDSRKYEGWSSFRELADRSYAPGWRGALQRALELHKLFVGFAVRFPYHLFDQFVFHYFRQPIAFEFFHAGQDFFVYAKDRDGKPEKGLAQKWLEASLRDQFYRGGGVLSRLRERAWYRRAERWALRPLILPLGTFLSRRLSLAIASAVAMGLLGAFAPALPLSFALTAIPYVGPALVAALNGLPVLVAAAPFVGHALAPVVAAATGALVKDLVLGPMLNTFILSTLLTFPASAGESLAIARDAHPLSRLSAREIASALGRTAVSGRFWRANLKSFLGLATVGSEIAGIMSYAGSVDAAVNPAYQAVTGGHFGPFGLFHAIGSAIERPKGQSVIPFGGAITWGSSILYNAQNLAGFNLSNAVMHAAMGAQSWAGFESSAYVGEAPAAALVHAASARDGAKLPFDPDLWKAPPAKVAARIEALVKSDGLGAELAAVKERMAVLRRSLGDDRATLAGLEKRSRPVTPAERADYERLLKQLKGTQAEDYVRSKLAENSDLLKGDPGARTEIARLKTLQKEYHDLLPPPPNHRDGYWDELSTRQAAFGALAQRLKAYESGRATVGVVPRAPLDPKVRAQIEALVGEIERQRTEVKAEMAQRDATQNLLRAANQIRNHALHERRDGKDMLAFHQDFAKLATVMDLALSLNEIGAAEAAISQMMSLLEAKRQAILASEQQNQQGQQGAAADQSQIDQWKKDAQSAVDGDQSSQKSMADLETEAAMAASRTTQFQQTISAFLASIDAMDKGSSPDAATQYQKDLDMLAQVAQWRTSGNPNDPTAFSLKGFQDDLAEVNGDLSQAQSGLDQIKTMPTEYAGTLVVLVPGPAVTATNPTKAQVLQILADRKTYWQQKLATYQSDLDQVNQMADPNHVLVDEFGLSHSYNASVADLTTLHPGNPAAGSKADALQDLKQLDQVAAELNSVTGSNIPMLSGLSLDQLQTAIKTYGDSLKAVKFPAGADTPVTHQAKMDLILAAQLTPLAARAIVNWSVDQATIDTYDAALAPGGALTVAKSGLTRVVGMIDAILADADQDVAFVQTGQGGGQALIDRKTALLQDTIVPGLTQAKSMLGTLITYEQGSIADVSGQSSQYYTLFSSEQTLLSQTQDLYNKTLPWSLASFGGAPGDVPGSLASIAAWKASLQQYIDGYTDAQGFHEGITQYQKDVADRQCQSGCTRTETLYGETQPYSLYGKISQYGAEKTQRAAEINQQDAQINEILGKLDALTQGKYNLKSYLLPTGIGTGAADVAKIQALVDANTIPNLGDVLKQVGDDAQAATGTGSISISAGSDGTVPVGTQPPITISQEQQIALLALDAAKRLVPSSLAQPQSAPEAYAVARYLFSDAEVSASQDALTNQIPQAIQFLNDASKSLGAAISQTALDAAYVNSNGTSETPDALYARKAAMFQSLDAFLKEAGSFYGLKTSWDQGAFATIDKVSTYYDSLNTIYTKGGTVNTNEITAVDKMEQALQSTLSGLEQTKAKVTSWMSQLDPKEQSALRRVSDDVSNIQDKTKAVLDSNIQWHQLQDQLSRSRDIISADLTRIDGSQNRLSALLARPDVQDSLPPDLVRRIDDLHLGRGAWEMGGARGRAQAIVVKKSEYSAFLDTLLGMLTQGAAQLSQQDVSAIKTSLLQNPQGLSSFIPGAGVMDFGNTADGFYLVYQSNFSVPNGLNTGTWVTLGNVGRLWGSNVSVSGYAFSSPPSSGGQNAPYGDKGVEVQVESLQHENSVNYLNIDLHRFGLDIPPDNSFVSNATESRLMIFDDYAMMMMGGKLYVGLAGYGDAALSSPGDHPYYYGGNLKTSLKLTEVMSLNASQQELFANDPRAFLQNVNLDFTGYDPSLNQNFAIAAQGDHKTFSRTQIGPSFDINRLLHPDGGGDTFTVDLYYAKTAGTDDINQQSLGAAVVKGFSIRNDAGKTWLRIDNRVNGEVGQQANTLGDTLSFTLPDKGIVISGQGEIVGGQSTRYAQIEKKTGDNTAIALGYGSQYVGQPDRLSVTLNTSFTLAQLWQAVADGSGKALHGGETLKPFNSDLAAFFKEGAADGAAPSATVQELERVYETDIGRKLISQDVGTLTRDVQDLRKAGAFMDNTRVRGMVGFTSNAVSNDVADLAVGGGFEVGTYTEMTLTKTQKALIRDKSASLYRDGLRLQDRLLETTKQWQAAVVDVAEAQWELRLADYEAKNAPSEAVRREAGVRVARARDALDQALLRYDALTGRDPSSPPPFADLTTKDLAGLMSSIRTLIAAPDRYKTILGQLSPDELKTGKTPFNAMDWLPWIDKFSLGFGVQYQDMLANQALTIGASVRLPIYDPRSKAVNHAYVLDSRAALDEMGQIYDARRQAAAGEAASARAWAAQARLTDGRVPAASAAMIDAIRRYRNGLDLGPDQLRGAFDAWRWYALASAQAQSQAALAQAQADVDAPFLPKTPLPSGLVRIDSVDDAVRQAFAGAHDLAEVSERAAAADAMARAENSRVQKFWLDLGVGTGLTAKGLGWIPSIGITGIPVTPVFGFELKPEELRELQVSQHRNQKAYYDALQTRLKVGLEVEFYQNIVALRSAETRLQLYDQEVLPALRNAGGGSAAELKLAQAEVGRRQTALIRDQARATLNLLLGRAADSPLEIDVDEASALKALSSLLAAQDPVGTEKAILAARVGVSKAVEDMVDKNLKVDVLQLEPVSLVVRALGRLIGTLSDKPIYNPDDAAAARIQVLSDERARDAYDGRRADQAAVQYARLRSDRKQLETLRDPKRTAQTPDVLLQENALAADLYGAEAKLLELGEDPNAVPSGRGKAPTSWADLTRRLAAAEQALSPAPADGAPNVPAAPTESQGSGAYARYYYAKQTLGHAPIDRGYLEGWIELRLKDPSTPPETLLALAKLRDEKAGRLYQDQLVGASAQADILAAGFAADVRLQRWVAARERTASDAEKTRLASFDGALAERLHDEGGRIASLLGLPAGATLDSLEALVPEQKADGKDPSALADDLIASIRKRQIGEIRRTLFSGGLPAGLTSDDDLMSQIKANTIAERMSYKGFTPVAAAGVFRGTKVLGAFMEAPDPRDIQRGLENVMSDLLRKQLESDGRMQELTLRLHQLMSQVADGSRELEAERREIQAAEADLKARTYFAATKDPAAVAAQEAAQQRLVADWSDFAKTMVDTKSAFITLVTELDALGAGSDGTLRPYLPGAAPAPRLDARGDLLDFWTERLTDPSFEAAVDARLAGVMPVDAAARARVAAAADAYRRALKDAAAVRDRDYATPRKLDLLSRNDVEGKRLALRDAVEAEIGGLGALDPRLHPETARKLIEFFETEARNAAAAGAASRSTQLAVGDEMRRAFWNASSPTPEEAAAYARLDALEKKVEDAREALMTDYLAQKDDGDPGLFTLTNARLDDYLKAQHAYDREMIAVADSPTFLKDPSRARLLNAVHEIRPSFDRELARAQHGRGIAALGALIMLEKTRLSAARWSRRPPGEIDAIAASLQSLREMRDRWTQGKDSLQPVYALAVRDGGKTTWSVPGWLTAAQFRSMLSRDPHEAGKTNVIYERDGHYYLDRWDPGSGKVSSARYEVIGGVDVARALSADARAALTDNAAARDLYARLTRPNNPPDFVAVGGPGQTTTEYKFGDVFAPKSPADPKGGLYEQGRLFFFEAPRADGGPQAALNPLDALSRRPEDVVVELYGGKAPLSAIGRDRFPTLQSLKDSDAASDFRVLVFSPTGAEALAAHEREYQAEQLRRGWIEVKLDSFGFARDAQGRMTQLYRTQDDFDAQRKAFANAQRDLAAAKAARAAALEAKDAAQAADDKAQAALTAASDRLRALRPAPSSAEA